MINVLERLHNEPWAITRAGLETLHTIALRDHNMTPELLEAKLGRPLQNTFDVEIRENGIAVMHVVGPLFRYANLFTEVSGCTSYQLLARDLSATLTNAAPIRDLVLVHDTPGGEANGCSEWADMIFNARGNSRGIGIHAYVGGQACSGGLWSAAACESISIYDTAIMGSLGVVLSFTDTRQRDEKAGVNRFDIVSSGAPDKRTDPTTDAGRAKVLQTIDALESVFVGKVAKFRGKDPTTVQKDFGSGGILVGQAVVSAGMADRIEGFEAMLTRIAADHGAHTGYSSTRGNARMDKDKDGSITASAHADAIKAAEGTARAAGVTEGTAAGIASERARIQSIMTGAEAKDRPAMAAHLAFESDMTADSAAKLLAKAAKEAPAVVATPDPKAQNAANFQAFSESLKAENQPVGADDGAAVLVGEDKIVADQVAMARQMKLARGK